MVGGWGVGEETAKQRRGTVHSTSAKQKRNFDWECLTDGSNGYCCQLNQTFAASWVCVSYVLSMTLSFFVRRVRKKGAAPWIVFCHK